jgi:bacteriorhodopsin
MNRRRLPHRRVILGLLGVPFIFLGVAILTQEDPTQYLAPTVAAIANRLFGWLWITAGFLAIVAMFASETRRVIEEVGYGFLFLPPFVWMSAYLITLIDVGGFFVFIGFLIATTMVVLILYLARYMRNG